jgi:hypothetical protein
MTSPLELKPKIVAARRRLTDAVVSGGRRVLRSGVTEALDLVYEVPDGMTYDDVLGAIRVVPPEADHVRRTVILVVNLCNRSATFQAVDRWEGLGLPPESTPPDARPFVPLLSGTGSTADGEQIAQDRHGGGDQTVGVPQILFDVRDAPAFFGGEAK